MLKQTDKPYHLDNRIGQWSFSDYIQWMIIATLGFCISVPLAKQVIYFK